jgi:chaperonin GroEL
VRDDMGYSLEKAGKEVLGSASKVVIRKDSTLIVTDGSTSHAVEKRVAMIKEQIKNSKERYNKKTLGERIARLCGGIAIIQVPHIVLVHCSKHFRGINFAMGMLEFEILARS